MSRIQTDRRGIEARPDPEGERLAGALDASVEHLGAGAEALESGTIEERVRAGRLSAENAAIAGRLLAKPGLVGPGEDWLRAAETMPAPELRRRVNERLEQSAQGVPEVVAVTVHVPPRTRSDFARARVLASREAGMSLTEGQTFALIVDRYLDSADERRRAPGSRRLGPTIGQPGDRYVPAAVRRAVLDRSDDRCEVTGCPHRVFLELAHIEPHAGGGSRETDNLVRLCHAHHTQFDAGCIRIARWRSGGDGRDGRDGRGARPVFCNARGVEITAGFAVDADAGAASGGASPRTDPSAEPHAAPGAGTGGYDVERTTRWGSGADPGPRSRGTDGERQAAATQVSERPPPPWTVTRTRRGARRRRCG